MSSHETSRTFKRMPRAIALAAATVACGGALLGANTLTSTAMPMQPMMSTSMPARMTTMPLGGRTRRVDPQMKAVLMSLMELKPKPIEKLTPAQARKQPGPPQAVKRTLEKQGGSTAPEPVDSVRDMMIPGNGRSAAQIPVRVYRPRNSGTATLPVLVYFHGGGFVIASVAAYDSSCRALANTANCMVVSVGYRYAPEHRIPAAHEDAYAATQYVMNNAGKMMGDTRRVAVGGESAGGNLATDMCIMARDRGGKMPVAQMLVYPYVDARAQAMNYPSALENAKVMPLNRAMLGWFARYALPQRRTPALNKLIAPLVFANVRGLPPATIVLAEIDPLLSQGQQYARKLARAGVPTRVRLFKGVTHEFFGMGAVIDQSKQAVAFAANGLKAAFNR